MRLLANDPNHRFQTASEVSRRINSISSAPPVSPVDESFWNEHKSPGASTIIENGVVAVAAFVKTRLQNLAAPVADDQSPVGHSDVWLTLAQIEQGDLPDVCVVCGLPTKRRTIREFQHISDSMGAWIVFNLIIFFPIGIIVALLRPRRIRLTLPVCHKHRNHWSILTWWVAFGWILMLAIIFGGLAASNFDGNGQPNPGFAFTPFFGMAAYGIPIIYLGVTRVALYSVTATSIGLKRVAINFARSVNHNRNVN